MWKFSSTSASLALTFFSCLANMKADSNLAKVKQILVDILKKTILPSKSKVSSILCG